MTPREEFERDILELCQKCMDIQYIVIRLGSNDKIYLNAKRELDMCLDLFSVNWAPKDDT